MVQNVTVRVLLCVSSVPASCVHIWFVSCPRQMSLWVNSCPAVFVSLSVINLCILVHACSVWFHLFCSLLPGVSCLWVLPCPALSCPDVLLKTIILSLRPRLCVLVPPSCVHRDSYNRFLFQINAVLLNFLFIKEYWKKFDSFHKNIKHNYFQHW